LRRRRRELKGSLSAPPRFTAGTVPQTPRTDCPPQQDPTAMPLSFRHYHYMRVFLQPLRDYHYLTI
jgi:hypothetical protein